MKLFNIDWERFLDHVALWAELDIESKRVLLELKPGTSSDDERFGSDLPLLVDNKVLQPYVKGTRVRLHEDFFGTAKALRAMERFPILLQPTRETLRDYIQGNFTTEERELLDGKAVFYGQRSRIQLFGKLSSATFLRGFLEAEDPAKWEHERVPEEHPYLQQQTCTDPLIEAKRDAKDVHALFEVLAAAEGPISFLELEERLKGRSRARKAKAILFVVRYALAFPCLESDDLAPSLTIWPPVAARWNRPPTPRPAPVDPADVAETFDVPWGVEDVTQLLVAASESLRLRSNDRALFAKAQREVESSLMDLPTRLLEAMSFEHYLTRRVEDARRLAMARRLLTEVGTRGKTLRLELTEEGRCWLASPPTERLAILLAPMRAPTDSAANVDPIDDEEVDVDPSNRDGEYVGYFEDVGFLPRHYSGLGWDIDTSHATAESGRQLDGGEVLPRALMLRHLVETTSPFSDPELHAHLQRIYPWSPPTEEDLEREWGEILSRFLWGRLTRFGGIRTGWTVEGTITIELTDIGRYLLRLTDDLHYDGPAPPSSPVRIQPGFEVVFLAPTPLLEAAFVRFAERLGTGVGVLFRITRESIHAAARAGLSLDEVLATLRDSSATDPPRNVDHEVRAWFAECRHLPLEPILLLRCPDEEAAARVRSAAGSRVEPISPTTLALDPAKRAEAIRLCKKAGLFLEGGEPEKPKKRKPRRRRQRYW